MKKTLFSIFGTAMMLCISVHASPTAFIPGNLAVLRIGDGAPDTGGTNKVSDWNFKQNAVYIDEFDPNASGAAAPLYTMRFPTNGPGSIWNNGNAGSEADCLSLSADRSILTYSAYNGDILSLPGTPSALPYHRIISVVNAYGTNYPVYIGDNWYGIATGKTNPRGVVSDGTNNFWGSGNNGGTLFYSPDANDGQPIGIQSFTPTRAVKIFNNAVYTTVTGKDSLNAYPCGIFNFIDFDSNPSPYPMAFAGFHLVVPAATKYTNISGFYMNQQGTIAYMADQVWGVQKYVKSGGLWQFQCNYTVQGFEQSPLVGGRVITNDIANNVGGAWDVVADFSGTNPIIYAVTCDFSFYNGNFNSNRVVRIVDTNTTFSAVDVTNFTVIAQATGTNVGFRGIDFVPDLRPVISAVSDDQSVVAGTPVSLSVTASQSYFASTNTSLSYQWYKNGATPLVGQTSSTLALSSPQLSDSGSTYQCVVSNIFGAVTSAPPINLTVTATAVAPTITGGVQNLTNAVGDNASITAHATGTTPLSYQWYRNGVQLSDVSEFSGTATKTLLISAAQPGVDDTNYECVVSNVAGSTSNLVANLKLVFTPPVFSSSPGPVTVFSNTSASFSCTVFGSSPSFQWYYGGSKILIPGATGASYTVNPATTNQNYFVVVTNLGGAITSAVASVTVVVPPPHTALNYTGQIYTQTFDSLPVITNATVNTANPNSFQQVGKTSPVTYSVDDPFDFGYPVIATGNLGGLGLTNTMAGWYGWGSIATKIGGHQGDQSTGGIIDYGTLSAINPNVGETNRALGIQSTSTTGNMAFGLKLINRDGNALSYINLSYIGEMWRNQPNVNTIQFSYYIASNTNDPFVPTNATAVAVPSLNVTFPPAGSLTIVDGSSPGNQISVAVTNLNIGVWPTNTALWLVWQQTNSAGSAQGMAIDNLTFSADVTPITSPTLSTISYSGGASGTGLQLSFSGSPGAGLQFTVWGTTNVALPLGVWQNLGHPSEPTAGNYMFDDIQATNKAARFYRVTSP